MAKGQSWWAGAVALVLTFLLAGPPAWAFLPQGNAVTDPSALLRNALPIEAPDLQELQHRLEGTSDDLRAKRWPALVNGVRRSQSLLSNRQASILEGFSPDSRDTAAALFLSLIHI
jgi:peptidylprolyl isomerase